MMPSNRDPATQMSDNQFELMIIAIDVLRMAHGDRFLIEGVEHARPLYFFHSADAGDVVHFIDADGIDDERRFVLAMRKSECEHRAKIRRMLSEFGAFQIGDHRRRDAIGATVFERSEHSAAADKNIDGFQRLAVFT